MTARHEITLNEEEVTDVSLGTFYVFDRESVGMPKVSEKVAWGCGGCWGVSRLWGCGGFRGCRGCGGVLGVEVVGAVEVVLAAEGVEVALAAGVAARWGGAGELEPPCTCLSCSAQFP
jgi:hypothetical protein